MARTLTTQDISWFLDLNEKGQLNLEPPYQRRSVWSPRDQRFFVDTILNNHPAPPIFLHKKLDENGRPTYHVVDGKQRLQTIIAFTENKVRIPDDFSDINLAKKRWKDLERETRDKFWNYVLIVEMLPDVSDAAIRDTFERINRNSRKLTAQELRHAKYEGWFIDFVETESEKPEWREFGIVTTARTKRMSDVQFISELCAAILKKSILGFDQDGLDELYAEYEDISDVGTFVEDDFTLDVARIKSAIGALLQHTPAVRDYLKVQSHFYTLWGYLLLEHAECPAIEQFAKIYMGFMRSVSIELTNPSVVVAEMPFVARSVVEYASASRGATTDLAPRKLRHAALTTAVQEGLVTAP